MAENIYALLRQAWSAARTDDANIFGVEVAIVTNVKDPDQQGRVKICFPRLPGKPESDWSRVCQPAGGDGRGFYWIPQTNDEVLVAFERGQTNRPYVIGALWNGKDKPMKDAYTDDNTRVMLQSASGHQVILEDKDGEETIVIADKSGKRTVTFNVKDKKLLIEAKEGDVELHAQKKIVLQCEDVEVKTSKTGKLSIGDTFELKVAQKAGFKAGPQFNIKADKVNLNPPSLDLAALVAAALAAAARAAAAAAGANAAQQQAAAQGARAGAHAGGAAPALVPSSTPADAGAGEAADGGAAGPAGAPAPDGTQFTKANQGTGAGQAQAAAAAGQADPGQVKVQVVRLDGTPQANLEFELVAPDGTKHAGKTDAQGSLQVDGLPLSGDCTLDLPDVKPAARADPSVQGRIRFVEGGVPVKIGAASVVEVPPRTRRCRLSGLNFETNKTFLLPTAMTGIRQLVKLFRSFDGIQGLVNGHTDKQPPKFGDSFEFNRKLSVERAQAIGAYLTDDVEAWQKFYAGTGASGQWGVREDQFMLATVTDGGGAPFYDGEIDGKNGTKTKAAYGSFQRSHLIDESGGPTAETRRELVREYMKLERTSLAPGTNLDVHGCGFTHPVPETEGDANPDQPKNRRVEVYLFDGPVDPRPVSPEPRQGCQEHAKWVERMILDVDLDQPPGALTVTVKAEDGSAISGAHVHASGALALDGTTGDDGVAADADDGKPGFRDLVPGSYKVVVDKAGFTSEDRTVDVPRGGSADVPIVLKKEALRVRLVTPEGNAIPGRDFQILDASGRTMLTKGKSDPSGTIESKGLPSGKVRFVLPERPRVLRLRVRKPGGPVERSFVQVPAGDEVELVFAVKDAASAQVVGANGRNVGAPVPVGSDGRGSARVRAEASGNFTVVALSANEESGRSEPSGPVRVVALPAAQGGGGG